MTLGPVEVLVLAFPGERVGSGVVDALTEVVDSGDVTILDLLFVARSAGGEVRVVEIEEEPDAFGFGTLEVLPKALTSDDDVELIADALEPGTSAAVLVYEHAWARRITQAIVDAGGEVALHVRIPRETVDAALVAAELPA
ncbi:MAG: DUF6325 family protein [Jiangellaceae bacterium]